MDDETTRHGVHRMAALLGVSESTMWRWLRHPAASCFGLVPISNVGGGNGFARAGQVSSLMALEGNIRAYTLSAVPKALAVTEVSSGYL